MRIRTLLIIILLTTASVPIGILMSLNLPRVLEQFDNAETNRKLLVLQQDYLEATQEITWCKDTLRALSFNEGILEYIAHTNKDFPREIIQQRIMKMVGGWYKKNPNVVAIRLVDLDGQEQLKMRRSADGNFIPTPRSELYKTDISPFIEKIASHPVHTVFNASLGGPHTPVSSKPNTTLLHLGVAIYQDDIMVGVACLAYNIKSLANQYTGAIFQQNQPKNLTYSAKTTENPLSNVSIDDFDFTTKQPGLVKDNTGKHIRLMPIFIGNTSNENIWMASTATTGEAVLWVQQWRQQILLTLCIFISIIILIGFKAGKHIEQFTSELSTSFKNLLTHQRPMHFSWTKTTELQALGEELTTLSTQYLENTMAREQMREQAEEMTKKLQQAKKMEAIGLLVGGVAHDLNNILTGVVSYPELLLLQLPEESPLRNTILEIQHSGERAAAVVNDLLTVARGVASTREICDLNQLIKEYVESPEYLKLISLHSHINYELNLTDIPIPISCSAIHIKKTIMNLIINASEAMPHDGTITISSALTPQEDGKSWIKLMIQDEGSGISAKDIDHIFEPFYTKNEMGRSGTGLGLSVVWNTMQDHNGSAVATSDERGTAFTLLFPLSDQNIQQTKIDSGLDLTGHGESILVVDDEYQPRDIAQKILEIYGYKVTAVTSGEEAIEFCKQQAVDLILLDMIMGQGLNGRQTYEKIQAIHPNQKAIIASGFSKDEEVRKAQTCGAHGFIKKPYTMQQLGQIVKEELKRT